MSLIMSALGTVNKSREPAEPNEVPREVEPAPREIETVGRAEEPTPQVEAVQPMEQVVVPIASPVGGCIARRAVTRLPLVWGGSSNVKRPDLPGPSSRQKSTPLMMP